jgi:hypothetical protein
MWLEAIVREEDLAVLLGELTPLSLALGDDGRLWLSEPSDVALVPGAGLRVTCSARIQWSLLGVHVPVKVHTMTVMLKPEAIEGPEGPAVVFGLQVEHADFAVLPDVLDDAVTERINEELRKRRVDLAWRYDRTLGHVFELPGSLDPAEALAVTAQHARVEVTSCAVGLAVEIAVKGRRGGEEVSRAVTAGNAAAARPPAHPHVDPRRARRDRMKRGAVVAGVAGVVAAVCAGAFTLGRRTA